MISVVLQIVAAYIVVDALTGLYHLATDKGFNLQSQIDLFENHHRTNAMEGFDWQPLVAAVPAVAVGGWLHSPFLIAAGLFGCVAQVPHYLAHAGSSNRLIQFLQRTGIIMSPAHHAGHHDGRFERNFCILSGWNNWWLNAVLANGQLFLGALYAALWFGILWLALAVAARLNNRVLVLTTVERSAIEQPQTATGSPSDQRGP